MFTTYMLYVYEVLLWYGTWYSTYTTRIQYGIDTCLDFSCSLLFVRTLVKRAARSSRLSIGAARAPPPCTPSAATDDPPVGVVYFLRRNRE